MTKLMWYLRCVSEIVVALLCMFYIIYNMFLCLHTVSVWKVLNPNDTQFYTVLMCIHFSTSGWPQDDHNTIQTSSHGKMWQINIEIHKVVLMARGSNYCHKGGCVYHCVSCFLYTAKVVTMIGWFSLLTQPNTSTQNRSSPFQRLVSAWKLLLVICIYTNIKGNYCPLKVGKWNRMGYWVKASWYNPAHCLISWKT